MSDAKTTVPDKLYYKAAEVCQITDTQPYVLRFWESEFPQLASEKNRSGQRVYRRQDIDLILRIKKLLYEEEFTIAGARKTLDGEPATVVVAPPARGKGGHHRPSAKHHDDEAPAAEAKKAAAAPTALFGEPQAVAAAAPEPPPAAPAQVPSTEVEGLKRDLQHAVAARDALRDRHRRIADRLQAALEA